MGDQDVHRAHDRAARQRFHEALLDDLDALALMLREGHLERGVMRIGLEQECFLVRPSGAPAPIAPAVLAALADPAFAPEIGRFNLEYNVDPTRFGDGALHALETGLHDALARARAAARAHGPDLLLTGILPSITRADLVLANLSPGPRYTALNAELLALAGGALHTRIQGDDLLDLVLDSVMLEACNTSIQVHLQVDPERLRDVYNLAQLATAPVLATAVNAPFLLQRRLWHETRIPSFEQSVDARSDAERARGSWQRVHFGEDWVHDSVLSLYRDQVARHPVLLLGDTGERSTARLARGEVPPLRALALHNGTLYRWNRLCYGVTRGVPHLRIEHRPLPAGPTVLDEVANAAFFLGLVLGLERAVGDVRDRLAFRDVRTNFHAAAHHGLEASLRWIDGTTRPARTLVLDHLLPVAHEGLRSAGIGDAECARYLGVITTRVAAGTTGAAWQRAADDTLAAVPTATLRAQAVTRALLARQWSGAPLAAWAPVTARDGDDWVEHVTCVQEIMSTDLFVVRPDDLLDVAAHVMTWKHIRHVPVQDDAGRLVGLLSHRLLLGHAPGTSVRDVMRSPVHTVAPETSCAEALTQLRTRQVGCLPVIHEGRLVGIVSERDLLPFAAQWFTRLDRREAAPRQSSSSDSS
jgi:predicted transcriptional regulator